uniref:Uncharacterized protein n=1 Tax=Gasterosteus aculeatus aculeatus TaxID=481459 RepID=A0AAQ4R0Z6_GASAC
CDSTLQKFITNIHHIKKRFILQFITNIHHIKKRFILQFITNIYHIKKRFILQFITNIHHTKKRFVLPFITAYLAVGELAVLEVVLWVQRADAGVRVVEGVFTDAVWETLLKKTFSNEVLESSSSQRSLF